MSMRGTALGTIGSRRRTRTVRPRPKASDRHGVTMSAARNVTIERRSPAIGGLATMRASGLPREGDARAARPDIARPEQQEKLPPLPWRIATMSNDAYFPILAVTLTGEPAGDDANPCLSCGACCAHFRVSFYFGEADPLYGGVVPPALVTPISPSRVCMQGTEQGSGRCVALRGTLGQPGIHCDIYEQRPTPCREFDMWEADGSPNPDCQRLRLTLNLPALLPRPDAENDPQGPATPNQPRAA